MNQPPDPAPLRVLVAEDNPVNQMVVASLLRKYGCTVDVVADGQAAVRACTAVRYDLVLMDCMMPIMDGYEATKALRALPDDRRLPIVALTARTLDGERDRCLAVGMDDYLTKPIEGPHLRVVVERWTRRSLPVEVTAPALTANAAHGVPILGSAAGLVPDGARS